MKPTERVLDVTSTLEGEKINMTIDTSALAHIMSVLTDLYSDPELAVIREYSTNAFDAHVEAGETRPIEVQTPTALAPFFKVRDYGEGLDLNDIRTIYSRYGTSTKRNSDDVVGMLGLGCKSALTYTDQFTLTGIKNGRMIQVSISRDADGSGSMTIVDERETDDPSGVEVLVPARANNAFESKAFKFFRFWTPGTVLVNGREPERIDGIWISDNLLLTQETDKDCVVMGNVAYPCEIPYPSLSYRRHRVVAFVNIGDVNFTPSRESLQMTIQTKRTIALLSERVKNEKDAAFQRVLDEAETHIEAISVYYEISSAGYDIKPPVWRGIEIPEKWKFPPSDIDTGKKDWRNLPIMEDTTPKFMVVVGNKVPRSRGWEWERTVQVHSYGNMIDYVWVTGWDKDSFTPYRREKLMQYCDKNNIATNSRFLFVRNLPPGISGWTDHHKKIKWVDIDSEKIVREHRVNNNGRPAGSYSGWSMGKHDAYSINRKIKAEDIDTSLPLFWEIGSANAYYTEKPRGFDIVRADHPDAMIILLGQNRVAKFQRDFPSAKRVSTYCTNKAHAWAKGLTDDDKVAIYFNVNSRELTNIVSLDPAMVDDPDLVSFINIGKAAQKKHSVAWTNYSKLKDWGATLPAMSFKNPIANYPLLTELPYFGSLRGASKDHLYLYINAAYNAAEKEA